MSLKTSTLSDASISESECIAQLKRRIEELEKDKESRIETIRDNLLQQEVCFFFDLGIIVDGISEKLKSAESGIESEMVLLKGFNEIKESLTAHSAENFHYPNIETETHDIDANSLPDGVLIQTNNSKIDVSVDYKKVEHFAVHYQYEGKNIEPKSVVAIRELCRFAMVEDIKKSPRDRRVKLKEIFNGRDFRERLHSLSGKYQKFGVNEGERILDIVSTHISAKDF